MTTRRSRRITRRRRSRRTTSVRRFFHRNWKKLSVFIGFILAIIVIVGIIIAVSNSGTPSVGSPSSSNTATLNGSALSVFNTQEEAEVNTTTIDAGTYSLNVTGSNIDILVTIGGIRVRDNILTQIKEGSYELNLSEVGDGTTVIGKISTGGDGSITGKLLEGGINTVFFSLRVNNPTVAPSATAELMGVPTGILYFGDDEDQFHVYGSEKEAQNSATITLPIAMVQNGLKVKAVCNDNTARLWVKPYFLDGELVGNRLGVVLSAENDWTNVLDVLPFAGHQLMLMLKAEDGWAINTSFGYIACYVPELD